MSPLFGGSFFTMVTAVFCLAVVGCVAVLIGFGFLIMYLVHHVRFA